MTLVGARTVHAFAPPPAPLRSRNYIRLPVPVWGAIVAVSLFISLASYDPLLVFACLVTAPLLASLIWRISEPPVAFAALMTQWLQVSVGAFNATESGVSLNTLFHTAGANYATWLSLGGLIVIATAIRIANWNRPPMDTGALHAELQSYSYSRVLAAYCIAQTANLFSVSVLWLVPGLTQALLAATQLRWLFYFLLAVTTLSQKRGYVFLAAATGFEIILGFTSFFSDFKTVFFIFAVSYLMVQRRITARLVVSLSILFSVLFAMAILWSAVKEQYRAYQNQGTGAQVSAVGTWDKLDYLVTLIGNIDEKRFWFGFERLTERIEYTRFFGLVTENVPRYLPYDDGAIWGAAVYHVITPRLLFPDKAQLVADIETTKHYTGLTFGGGGAETEIPLGYMAESYIDFGPIGMYVPIFLLGLLLGLEYRYFATRKSYRVFAYGVTPVIFGAAIAYEETSIKLLGGNLTIFIVCFLVCRFAFPVLHRKLLSFRPAV